MVLVVKHEYSMFLLVTKMSLNVHACYQSVLQCAYNVPACFLSVL